MPRLYRTLARVKPMIVVLAVVGCGLTAKPAEASPIGITYTMNLTLIAGANTLGLDGALVTFNAQFDTSQLYTAGLPSIAALSNSLTIAGATVATSNGVFTSNNGIRFFPTFLSEGQFFSTPGGFANYTVGAVPLLIGHLATPTLGAAAGDPIEAADFGLTVASTALLPGCVFCATTDVTGQVINDSRYGATNFTATITPSAVPEPASLTLLGIGLAAASRKLLRTRRTQ